MARLAIIATHPIQYHAPWFRSLAAREDLTVKVFYLWNAGATTQLDAGFGQEVKWDIPLLDGYEHEFVPNISTKPGTSHFRGLTNPSLSARVRSFTPDAVLVFGYNYHSLMRFIFGWRDKSAPLLFRGDSHRLVKRIGAKAWLRHRLIRSVFKRFAAFLYVGQANRDYFRYHDVPEHKLFFAPHAIDNERFMAQAATAATEARQWKGELGIPADNMVVLFAGKFEKKKRPLDLLMAFLLAGLADVSLLFVGSGELEAELKKQATGHPQIFFAPFQNQTMMPRTYAAADLFVLPSHGPNETWGLAINEAMCQGCPVVVSSHVGCARDLVHPGQNGLVFPAGDVTVLADCLKEAFSDRVRLYLWGEESRRIVADYSYAQMTAGLLAAMNGKMVSLQRLE